MKLRIFRKSVKSDRTPFFTPQDRENISWFWTSYLKKRMVWLFLVLGLILLQGLVYQQFLRLTESGLRVIFDQGAVGDLVQVCAMVFGLFFVRGITSYVVPRTSTWLASTAVMELRRDLTEKLLVLDLAFFERSSPAEIILRVVTQAQTLSRFVGQVTINAVRDLAMVVIVSSYLIYKAPVLFLTALIIAPIILLTLQFVSRRIKQVQRTAEAALGTYMNTLEETVNGMRTVKISNQEEFEEARLQETNEKIRGLQVRVQSAQAIVLPAIDFASAFAYAMVIGLGGFMAISPNYDIDGAAIITFMLGLVMVFDPMRSLAKFFTQLQQQLVQLDSVHSIMRQTPSIVDAPGATDDFDAAADITLEKVTFGYQADRPLFEELDLTFEGGKRTAIVGATGSGKTTVLSLLGRLYDIQGGEVKIGEHNVRDIHIAALRKSFSVVAQDIVIFNASIWENIKYVRPQSTDEEIWAAAEAAEIAALIRERGGAPLGPKGAQLSGGQKQRIAIARAFLRSAPILLLDEATSALDQRTEERIKGALNRLSEGKTTIIVAHRLSSVIDSDKIYVLDQGRVVETGTHEELLAMGGLYAGMYTTQKEGYR